MTVTWGIRLSFFSRSGVRGLLLGSDSAAATMSASPRRGKGPGSGSAFSRPSGSTRTSSLSVFLRRTEIVSSFILRRLTRRYDTYFTSIARSPSARNQTSPARPFALAETETPDFREQTLNEEGPVVSRRRGRATPRLITVAIKEQIAT